MPEQIIPIEIKNIFGDSAVVLNYGARLHQWQPELDGKKRELLLSYSNIEDYLNDAAYLGAIAGPFANRIANGEVSIDGKTIELGCNEGNNHLHGGPIALHNSFWQIKKQEESSVTLALNYDSSANTQMTYPGPIQFEVTYSIANSGELLIQMHAETEQITCVGMTGHAYFNLSEDKAGIDAHALTINAKHYTPVDHENIPTGELMAVHDKFDFTASRAISEDVDHNFVLNDDTDIAAVALSPRRDIELCVSTNYPGIQLYTGHGLGEPFLPRQGFCLEPQFFPNSPNEAAFAFEWTTPEKPFNRFIKYNVCSKCPS